MATLSGLSLESLENRRALAAFAYDSVTKTLSIDLDNALAQLEVTSSGGGNYIFTSASGDSFTGTDQKGLTGNGTTTLTVTDKLDLSSVTITDSKSAIGVLFLGSTGDYVDDFSVVLDETTKTSPQVSVVLATAFADAASLSIKAANIRVLADLSTALGQISLNADAGAQLTGTFAGVSIDGVGTVVSTAGGDILIQGRGGDGSGVAGAQHGVLIADGAIVSAGDTGGVYGTVSITGLGGTTTPGAGPGNHGILIESGSTVSSSGGEITLTGTGGAVDNDNCGVVIGGTLQTATGLGPSATGAITVAGTGGGDPLAVIKTGNSGVLVAATGAVSSVDGAISMTGAAGAQEALPAPPFTTSPGVDFLDGEVKSTTGAITFTADSFAGTLVTGAIETSSTVTIRNLLAGQTIGLSAANNALLGKIVADTLVVGRADPGLLPVIAQDPAASGGSLTLLPGTNLELIASSISLQAAITTSGGTQTYSGPVTLQGDATITSKTSHAVAFQSSIDSGPTPRSLTVSTGAGAGGTITFTGAIGGKAALGGLALDSAAAVTSLSTVALDGTAPSASDHGLRIAAGVNAVDMQVAGSSIANFRGSGILLGATTGSTFGGFTISANGLDGVQLAAGDYLGTVFRDNLLSKNIRNGFYLAGAVKNLAIGATAAGNEITGNSNGVIVGNGSSAVTLVANRMSGNDGAGVRVLGAATSAITIQDNVIGLDAAGKAADANGAFGIVVSKATGTLISSNTISGNASDGIVVVDDATSTTITGNTIGLNASATAAVPNGRHGIFLPNAVGTTMTSNNVSGNVGNGIYLAGGSTGAIASSTVSANGQNGILVANLGMASIDACKVGVAADGSTAAGNAGSGIFIQTVVAGASVTGSLVRHNGTNGITVVASPDVVIGGAGSGDANDISSNVGYGVYLQGPLLKVTGTKLLANTIASNKIGIGLVATNGLAVGDTTAVSVGGNSQYGLYAEGGFTASSVGGITVTASPIGIALVNATGLVIDGTTRPVTISGVASFGVYATGVATGTVIKAATVSGGAFGVGIDAATGLSVDATTISGASTAGVLVVNGVAGSGVQGSTIENNNIGVLIQDGIGFRLGGALGTPVPDPAGNIIRGNTASAVIVAGVTAVSNRILSNSIFGNGFGITLAGGNNNQPPPTLSGATATAVTGTLTASAGTYRIQYFKSLGADASSPSLVQGRTLLASRDVTISGSSIAVDQAISAAIGDWISAVATKVVGGVPTDSSQFSFGVKVA